MPFDAARENRTADLVKALRAGDESAFAEIYSNYSAAVRGVILQMVRDFGLAEDLTQETFLRLWTSANILDENARSLGPWLITVARHIVLDYLRSPRNRNHEHTASDVVALAKHAVV